MSTLAIVVGIIVGAAGTFLAGWISWALQTGTHNALFPTWANIRVVHRLRQNGIVNVRFARSHHTESKDDLIRAAESSIEMIAFSLRGSEVAPLCSLFQAMLARANDLTIHVSLLDPKSEELDFVARSYRLSSNTVRSDVQEAMAILQMFRGGLNVQAQARVTLSYHRCPMGTATLIDCRGQVGKSSRIQPEFKLYRVPREYAFGYDVKNKGKVFQYNLESWRAVLSESRLLP